MDSISLKGLALVTIDVWYIVKNIEYQLAQQCPAQVWS